MRTATAAMLTQRLSDRGEIWLETTAYLPDSDYEGGTRVEVDKMNTGIKIV